MRRKYGDEYCIASAYEMKALDWPSIKADDGVALNRFLVFLASYKNALAGSEYISNFDQPGNIQKLVLKLPYNMRERWRRFDDGVMDRQSRSVQRSDFVAFVDREARIITNSVFGKISIRSPTAYLFVTLLYRIWTRTSGLASQPSSSGRRFLCPAATARGLNYAIF